MPLIMRDRFASLERDIGRVYGLPYELIIGTMKTQTHLAIRIPHVVLYILFTPLFTIIPLTPIGIIVIVNWIIREWQTGSPPVMAPGHRWKDHKEAAGRALARITPRRRAQTVHTHGSDIPHELMVLILNHLDPVSNYRTLLDCAFVCPCWLAASRLRAFGTIYLDSKRAYAGWRLLRSPHCTFIPCIRFVILQDLGGWNIADTLLRQLIRSNVTPSRLILQLFTSIIIPPRQTSFCSQLTTLRIVKNQFAFGRNLSRFAAFIAAFPVLGVLDIDSKLDFDHGGQGWGTKPPSPAPQKSQYAISPHLRQLTIRHFALVEKLRLPDGEPDLYGDINLPYLILQHRPKLDSLTLVAPGHGYGPYMSALSDYFVTQGKFLQHLAISLPLTGAPGREQADGVGLNRMIPVHCHEGDLAGPQCHFPALRTLHLTHNSDWAIPTMATIDFWLLTVARGAPLLEKITVGSWLLNSATANTLKQELGFKTSDFGNSTTVLYQRARVGGRPTLGA